MHTASPILSVMKWLAIVLLLAVAVVCIRLFCIASYRISTDSMKDTLGKGDRILVDKLPMKGNPGRNRVVLFHSPLLKDTLEQPLFLSRCVGMPGDTILVSDRGYSINGKQTSRSPSFMQAYFLPFSEQAVLTQLVKRLQFPPKTLKKVEYGYTIDLTLLEHDRLKKEWGTSFSLKPSTEDTAPYTLMIPRKDRAYRLDEASLVACREAILLEAGDKAVFRDGKLYLDGRETSFFFFRQDYYWMLSDNPDEAVDSRHLGLIPADHIVGNAFFCWYSSDTRHLFKPVH